MTSDEETPLENEKLHITEKVNDWFFPPQMIDRADFC